MDLIATVMTWVSAGVATGYGAALVGGILILIVERFDRWREPSDGDVRRAAACYRHRYGDGALQAIGEHMQAATFAPDRRHRRFLERVLAELSSSAFAEREKIYAARAVRRGGAARTNRRHRMKGRISVI